MCDCNQWRDIETAPRDGTKILVLTHHDEVEISEWYELSHDVYVEVSEGLYRKDRVMTNSGWNSNTPIAWLPLHQPPKKEGV